VSRWPYTVWAVLTVRFACVSRTPLGAPVVPLVNGTQATSPASASASRAGPVPARSISSASVGGPSAASPPPPAGSLPVRTTVSRSGSRGLTASTSRAASGGTIATRASQARSTCSRPSFRSSGFTRALRLPAREMP
jgi:hypothetical protein